MNRRARHNRLKISDWKSPSVIVNLILAITTFLMAVATFVMVYQTEKQIKNTREMVEIAKANLYLQRNINFPEIAITLVSKNITCIEVKENEYIKIKVQDYRKNPDFRLTFKLDNSKVPYLAFDVSITLKVEYIDPSGMISPIIDSTDIKVRMEINRYRSKVMSIKDSIHSVVKNINKKYKDSMADDHFLKILIKSPFIDRRTKEKIYPPKISYHCKKRGET